MIFKHQNDQPVKVNQDNFKQMLNETILGSPLTKVEFVNGTMEWLKATHEEIRKASVERPH